MTLLMMFKWWFLSKMAKKTLWEKEKMLVTSIFSFSHNVVKKLLLLGHENQGLFGKALKIYWCIYLGLWWLTLSQASPGFSFSCRVFYPFGELSAIFIKFEVVVCKLFHFGRVWNLSFGKGLTLTERKCRLHKIGNICRQNFKYSSNDRIFVF